MYKLDNDLDKNFALNVKNKMSDPFTKEITKFIDFNLVERLKYAVVLDFFPVDYLVSNFVRISVIENYSNKESAE